MKAKQLSLINEVIANVRKLAGSDCVLVAFNETPQYVELTLKIKAKK